MSSYQKPTLESFGTFRDITRFGLLSYFFSRYSGRRWTGSYTYSWNTQQTPTTS